MTDDPSLNQSVQKAVAILRAAAERPGGESVSGLARAVDLPRATALRLIRTLQREGLLLRFPGSDRVGLGIELRRLADLVDVRDALIEAARSPLARLALETQETVTLTIVESDGALATVEQINPSTVLQLADTKGRRRDPLHATSNGKLLLSTMNDEGLVSALEGPLERLTPKTITDPELLQLAVADIRRVGYAQTIDEFEMGVTSLSAGIVLHDALAGIVAVTGPTSRLDARARTSVARHAIEAARAIEGSIGGSE
jgi:IclR family transcriptional regulator, acetate operon repressor